MSSLAAQSVVATFLFLGKLERIIIPINFLKSFTSFTRFFKHLSYVKLEELLTIDRDYRPTAYIHYCMTNIYYTYFYFLLISKNKKVGHNFFFLLQFLFFIFYTQIRVLRCGFATKIPPQTNEMRFLYTNLCVLDHFKVVYHIFGPYLDMNPMTAAQPLRKTKVVGCILDAIERCFVDNSSCFSCIHFGLSCLVFDDTEICLDRCAHFIMKQIFLSLYTLLFIAMLN